MLSRPFFFLLSLWLMAVGSLSCQPDSYSAAAPDTLDSRFYCNIPEAVNYNWGFPGRKADSLCRFPSDYFAGTYRFVDSLYFTDGSFDSAGSLTHYTVSLQALNRQKLALYGICSDSLRLTADRFFRASLDTTIPNGQPFCRAQDTVSGGIMRLLEDSVRLSINFTVVGEGGTTIHRGTAYRQ